jgi:hypothetical protein
MSVNDPATKKASNRKSLQVVLCEFAIDLITVIAGAVIAVAIIEEKLSLLYVSLAFGLVAVSIPFRLWKYTVENKQ